MASVDVEVSVPWEDDIYAGKLDAGRNTRQAGTKSAVAAVAAVKAQSEAAPALPTGPIAPLETQPPSGPAYQEAEPPATELTWKCTVQAADVPAARADASLLEHVSAKNSTVFEEVCNDGSTWTKHNWMIKLYRCTLLLLKQVYLYVMTLSLPTNHLMLTFRTLPRDFSEPNSNSDHLAARFRNAVMPTRGKLHDQKNTLIKINRWFIELPLLGIPGIVRFIDVRTQWFDQGVSRAINDGIKQVVVIAAGYDTRAYRLSAPGVKFYEIDLPHASKHKKELVQKLLPEAEYSRPEFVAADLSKVKLADALANTSFDPNQPTLFTAEGLIYYLPPPAVQQLLTCISNSSAPGSRLMFDFLHLDTLAGNVWHPGFETLILAVANKGEKMYTGIQHDPEQVAKLMKSFGFKTEAVLDVCSMVKQYMPHVEYRSKPPTVSPYFGYISAVKQ